MPSRTVLIPQIGEVLLSKRRGAKNLRLSITAKGQVRVSMPSWAPYSVGISFARKRELWIKQQLSKHNAQPIENGARIGRKHRVTFTHTFGPPTIRVRNRGNVIEVRSSIPFESAEAQDKIIAASEKALRAEAQLLLPRRLDYLAGRHGFSYKDLRIRKLVSRWGSCSHDKVITLSYYLVQLPDELVDYVLLHELNHTKHHHHGSDFWSSLTEILPNAKALQKRTKEHQPRVWPL